MSARDARFDGQFITGVHSTGIYCRPSCPAVSPKPSNVTFYLTAAAAHEAGLRACKRCLPDAVPGSPEWNMRDDLAARAMRLIADGTVEREGRPRARPPARLHAAAPRARARRRAGRRSSRPRPRPPRSDGPPAARRHRPAHHRRRVRRRLHQRPPVQRDDGRHLPHDARRIRAGAAGRARAHAVARRRPEPRRPRRPCPCACPPALRSTAPPCSRFLAARSIAGVESRQDAGTVIARAIALPHGPATVRLTLGRHR